MTRTLLVVAATAAFLGLGAAPSIAQTRVFVSGAGSDTNPCSIAAPCRTFQQAHNTVAAGGEIVALDAAGYGPLDITKAVTVTAIGIEASITSNGTGPAVSINAAASDAVTIRGLTVLAGPTSTNGIVLRSARSVTIRDCSVSGFIGDGIDIGSSANTNVEIRGVSVENNGTDGLNVAPLGSGSLTILVTDSTFNRNGAGSFANGNGIVVNGGSWTGSIIATFNVASAANAGIGVAVGSGSGVQPVVMVTGSKVANNGGGGVKGTGNVQVFVDGSQISGNSKFGWLAFDGAAVSSYKNNAVNGNANDDLNGVIQISSE